MCKYTLLVMYLHIVLTHCMYTYRSYDNKVYTCIYRGYYKIIVIVLLVVQGGYKKVWYNPFGLGSYHRHSESVCVPLYYVQKVNTLYTYNIRIYHITESCISTLTSDVRTIYQS